MPKPRILLVDDNPSIFRSLGLNLQDSGYAVAWARDGAEAMEMARENRPDLVLLDLSLGKEDGIEVLQNILAEYHSLPVVMITGYGTFEAAVKSIKIGAYDFLPKPLDFDHLLGTIDKALGRRRNGEEDEEANDEFLAKRLVTRAQPMLAAYRKAKLLAKTDLPVLITGESGSGKELLVELIHENSTRKQAVLRRINCSAYPETLIDNELFGHEKGAYTGADNTHQGLFEQAHNGTLHLDEIADLALPSQAKLLRVLEDGAVFRLGGRAEIKVDVRVIATTNKNIPEMIEEGTFRKDLFYRLNAVFIYLPPVREHQGDLELLLKHFVNKAAAGGERKWFSPEALKLLHRYPWPGNVRELKNTVNMCVALSSGSVIGVETLPHSIVDFCKANPAPDKIDQAEKDLIMRVLEESHYNKQKASQRLGISRKTLYNKLKGYGLDNSS